MKISEWGGKAILTAIKQRQHLFILVPFATKDSKGEATVIGEGFLPDSIEEYKSDIKDILSAVCIRNCACKSYSLDLTKNPRDYSEEFIQVAKSVQVNAKIATDEYGEDGHSFRVGINLKNIENNIAAALKNEIETIKTINFDDLEGSATDIINGIGIVSSLASDTITTYFSVADVDPDTSEVIFSPPMTCLEFFSSLIKPAKDEDKNWIGYRCVGLISYNGDDETESEDTVVEDEED